MNNEKSSVAQLRITLRPDGRKNSGDCSRRLGNTQEPQAYEALLPDETVSSWVSRHSCLELTSDHMGEETFGILDVDLPAMPRSLLSDLRHAATPPDAWMLLPFQRTSYCARCLVQDWARGITPYERRAWSVAWRTCCPQHGMLLNADPDPVPTWPYLLSTPVWSNGDIRLSRKRPYHAALSIGLYGDRRAIHLEEALATGPRRAVWFPKGLGASSLRWIYPEIVNDLMNEFYLQFDRGTVELPDPRFNDKLNSYRFAVNAMAEAILSVWTNTPLPDCASAQRTHLIVRAIGWGDNRPAAIRRGQVLFSSPYERTCDLSPYKAMLRPRQYQKLSNPTKRKHRGYFTLSEARQLGFNVASALHWLSDLTRKGQFLAFHAKSGRLSENVALPEGLRLQPADAEHYRLVLPEWAFGPPKPKTPVVRSKKDRTMFEQPSPEPDLLGKALRRRETADSQRNVRFQPEQTVKEHASAPEIFSTVDLKH